MANHIIDHTNQPPDLETIIVASTHLTEEAIPDPRRIHLTQGVEDINGTKVTAINCWEISIDEKGGLNFFSYAPLNKYPAYPRILFDANQAKDILTLLRKFEEQIEAHCDPERHIPYMIKE